MKFVREKSKVAPCNKIRQFPPHRRGHSQERDNDGRRFGRQKSSRRFLDGKAVVYGAMDSVRPKTRSAIRWTSM